MIWIITVPNQNKIGKNTTSKFQSSFSKRLIQASGWILWIFALLLMLALISSNPYDPSFNSQFFPSARFYCMGLAHHTISIFKRNNYPFYSHDYCHTSHGCANCGNHPAIFRQQSSYACYSTWIGGINWLRDRENIFDSGSGYTWHYGKNLDLGFKRHILFAVNPSNNGIVKTGMEKNHRFFQKDLSIFLLYFTQEI